MNNLASFHCRILSFCREPVLIGPEEQLAYRCGVQPAMAIDRIVVIGTSLGGVEALQTLAAGLPHDFPAAVLIVQHIGNHPSRLPEILTRRGPLSARHAVDGDPIVPGRLLLAPPDLHMLVDGDVVRLARGAKEHHARPAVDPLFLSAALERGKGVIGVILTGGGQDGTAGLQAVKQCGGIAVVQDPREAIAPGMPRSASTYVEIDHCVRMSDMARLLLELVRARQARSAPVDRPASLVHEYSLIRPQGDPMEHLKAIAKPSAIGCPDCSGGLWEIVGSLPRRYRCHTGHSYSLTTLQQYQANETDAALWSALRALQEKSQLLDMLASSHREAGDDVEGDRLDEIGRAAMHHAGVLRELIQKEPPQEID